MAYKITGVTRDNTGNLTGSVDVFLLKYNSGTHLFTQVAHGTSDASTGVFTFTGIVDNDATYNIVAFKDGTPHIFDVSDRNLQPVSEAPSYVGPGDVDSNWFAWWGLRGYSAAYAAPGNNPAIDVIDDPTGLITTTINILANGDLDIASIVALGYTVKIWKFYDQTGNGRHFIPENLIRSACAFWDNTAFTTGAPASRASFPDATQRIYKATLGGAVSTPCTVHCVALTIVTTGNDVFNSADYDGGFFWQAGKLYMYAGNNASTAAATFTNNVPYSLQYLFNGASSSVYVNGTANSLNPGNNGITASGNFRIGTGFLGNFQGYLQEIGINTTNITGTGVDANARAYWGNF